MQIETMPCPICEAPAAEEPPHITDSTIVACPNCERYKIADSMIPSVMAMEPELRKAILDDAKRQAGPEELPYVSSP
jgi:hypothetical protein